MKKLLIASFIVVISILLTACEGDELYPAVDIAQSMADSAKETMAAETGNQITGNVIQEPVVPAEPVQSSGTLPIYDHDSWEVIGYLDCAEVWSYEWSVESFDIESGGYYVCKSSLFGHEDAFFQRFEGNNICQLGLP